MISTEGGIDDSLSYLSPLFDAARSSKRHTMFRDCHQFKYLPLESVPLRPTKQSVPTFIRLLRFSNALKTTSKLVSLNCFIAPDYNEFVFLPNFDDYA